ncbi:tRNA-splicing endonuclease subunit Sen2 [Microdochium nivale]|nr:tRNA-splicing endonuclease subunit Sen2 [Microdochium nivale]
MPEPSASSAHNGHPPVPLTSSNDAGVPDVKKTNNNNKARSQGGPKKTPLHQIYTLPAPVRTFPLPSFYPSNPLSLFHVLYAWVRQAISPPPREPAVVHRGFWSAETRSVHVVDQAAIRALWEQGFFGKGTYSRSEPNWLKREQSRRGEHADHVAENFTAQRRRERNQMKWERARKEQEVIQRTRMQEAWVAPVGPMELLALPNSALDLGLLYTGDTARVEEEEEEEEDDASMEGNETKPDEPSHANGTTSRQQKSVRFSPKVEANTYNHSDPPRSGTGPHTNEKNQLPNGSVPPLTKSNNEKNTNQEPAETQSAKSGESAAKGASAATSNIASDNIKDIEHLQLALEEAFYLSFALGVLEIMDPKTGKLIPPREQLAMFRQISSQPRKSPSLSKPSPTTSLDATATTTSLRPDDPFLLQYATYHHFRSLGWTVRPGIKFGVDWLLYHRGPVFSHAEFAVLVLPAYSHPWWQGGGQSQQMQMPKRSWHWLHCANRVQAKALKTLVLAYVEVPPPVSVLAGDCAALDLKQPRVGGDAQGQEGGEGIADILGRYRIREFMVKRWLSNRNRD